LSDTFEAGKSLTVGIDYKKESNKKNVIKENIQTEDINDYFEIKLATVFKDKNEDLIPESSTLDKKSSNLFGSIKNQYTAKSESSVIDLFSLSYYFSLDNDLNALNYNSFNSELSIGNFKSELNFIKESGVIGNTSSIQNTFSYNHDNTNFFSFNTRRNRKINLTEYYDFVYEYKNDCLTAGVKYKKTYYQDRDIKPTEDLMLTFTFYPLTTYEQEIDQDLYRN
jgi:LPS-assembly protein